MSDYIKREQIYADISRFLINKDSADLTNSEDGWTSAISKAMDMIMDAPAAVRPERHGEWLTDDSRPYRLVNIYCSECSYFNLANVKTAYCPHCGAKMDGSRKSDSWIATSEQLPPENQIVDTKIDDEKGVRNEWELVYSHNLWFFPDFSMYVYYTPTHWRRKERTGEKDGESDG